MRRRGFTLIELLIALAIVALLLAVAFPSYTRYIQRSKRAEARAVLLEAAQYMERAFSANGSYPATLPPRLGTAPPGAAPGLANYVITLVVGPPATGSASSSGTAPSTSYTLTATPSAPDPCGNLTLNEAAVRGASGTDMSAAQCWN